METIYEAVKHVGSRMVQPDTVCRTATIWRGYGDVQVVEKEVARRLCNFPKVFVPATIQELEQVNMDKQIVQEALKKHKAEVLEGDLMEDSDELPEPDAQAPLHHVLQEGEAASMREILTAISSLKRDNPEHFSEHGKPRVAAVRIAAGNKTIKMNDINKAWEQLESK